MNQDERRQCLLAIQHQLLGVEAESQAKIAPVFLPLPGHVLALRKETVVVLGGRGAGKSALFRVLQELNTPKQLRDFFGSDVPDATWLDAFSQAMHHPQVEVLDEFATRAEDLDLRAFWMTHLVRHLVEQHIPGLPDAPFLDGQGWQLERARTHVSAAADYLDRAERVLEASGRLVFATYDHLDRLGQFDARLRQRYLNTLLALWLSLSNRYQHLRGKLFVREDLFDGAQASFADAGKLRGRSASLEWDVPALYRLLVRYMAFANEGARQWLKTIGGLNLHEDAQGGWLPPEMGEPLQRAFAERLAGRLMGTGVKKGFVYRWIPKRLQDGRVRIVPRSILNLVGHACAAATSRPLKRGTQLLRPQELWAALEPTSRARVREVAEEYPPVQRLEHLRGQQVLMERDFIVSRLDRPAEGDKAQRTLPGSAVFDELVRLGVLVVRDDRYGGGRVDVPDLYRYGYGILRKGGVARPS